LILSENELIKNYHVSNTTARKSLLDIENRGWAKRIKGKGTFMLNRTAGHHLVRTLGSIYATRRGFHESLLAEGFTPRNLVLKKTILENSISSEIGGKQFIMEGPVLKIHQLRYADEEIIKDEIKDLSLKLCPRINRMSTDNAYFKVYENTCHLRIEEVIQTLSVVIVQPGAPALIQPCPRRSQPASRGQVAENAGRGLSLLIAPAFLRDADAEGNRHLGGCGQKLVAHLLVSRQTGFTYQYRRQAGQ
jgi:DNA-binding GntR family transcriptional regulator